MWGWDTKRNKDPVVCDVSGLQSEYPGNLPAKKANQSKCLCVSGRRHHMYRDYVLGAVSTRLSGLPHCKVTPLSVSTPCDSHSPGLLKGLCRWGWLYLPSLGARKSPFLGMKAGGRVSVHRGILPRSDLPLLSDQANNMHFPILCILRVSIPFQRRAQKRWACYRLQGHKLLKRAKKILRTGTPSDKTVTKRNGRV